ncbi:sodium:proton antiporter [uncultured Alistipes sp.]|uniref:sodium:proton antiporter n=1 Tax=uncultured Alistipes sp. TaxID=538949 RepID=UPI0028037534|nr:sodium:proton antiporter [uncultured Alistipes sp.]
MRKVLSFSLFLMLGLVASQLLPGLLGPAYSSLKGATDTLLYICLGFIMINVGREFEIDKSRWRSYTADYFIAMATAALPWLLIVLYYIFVLLPPELWSDAGAWKENLLLSRFAAPTSAGILFTMLAALRLQQSWIYRKIQVLAIFDDLDTILLMIPLQILMIGLKWQMFAIVGVVVVLLAVGWRWQATWNVRQDWKRILGLSVVVCAVTQGLYLATAHWYGPENSIHIEVLLPAFVIGMLMRHRHLDTPTERRVSTGISFLFMLLVGLSMPLVTGAGGDAAADAATSVTGSQPMMPWGIVALHVVAVSLLSNIGKLVPLLFYRDRRSSERLALSVGMFTRGEVGAGVIFIALGYNLGGPALIISVLTLVLNLILTGGFVVWVRKLALRSYTPSEE